MVPFMWWGRLHRKSQRQKDRHWTREQEGNLGSLALQESMQVPKQKLHCVWWAESKLSHTYIFVIENIEDIERNRNDQQLNRKPGNWDFPGGPVVKNLPCNAGNSVFDPWSGNYEPTWRGAIRPKHHNYWAHSHNQRVHGSHMMQRRCCVLQLNEWINKYFLTKLM